MNKLFVVFFCILILTLDVNAQKDTTKLTSKRLKRNFLSNRKGWSIEVPVWIPGFRGDYAYGDISLEGEDGEDLVPENPIENPKPGDVFRRLFNTKGNLNFFFMNRISYSTDKIYTQFDVFSGTVGGSLNFRFNNAELVKGKFHTNLFRIYAGYEIVDKWTVSQNLNYRLHVYGGIRIHDVNVHSEVNKTNLKLTVVPLWVAPIVGVRNELALKRWLFVLNGDMSFWDIENKFAYMINFYAYFRISNLISAKAGWADWEIKHDKDYLGEELKLNVHLAGPSAGVTFHF